MKKTIRAALAASFGLFAATASEAQKAPPVAPPAPPMPVPRPVPMPMIAMPPPPPMVAPMPPAPPMPATPASLRNSFVYVYNFLDVREEQYGDKVLAQFDAQLIDRLEFVGAHAKVLRYRDSPAMKPGGSHFGSTMIPVAETIFANLADEAATGAKYRLIAFPASYTLSGAWRFYEVRWILVDVRTNRKIWSYLYSGKHLVMLRTNENAEARGRKLVRAAWDSMKAAGLL